MSRRYALLAILALGLGAFVGFVVEPHRAALHVLLRMEGAGGGLAEAASWGRPRVEVSEGELAGAKSRVYRPNARPKSVILLLHGMHRLGYEEPRLIELATALAEAGHAVHTPELERLASYRLEVAEAERIGEMIRAAASEEGAPRVGVFGVSFAGGLALVAASEPAVRAHISALLALGGHGDLVRVTRFYAGEGASGPGGEPLAVDPHPYGIEILLRDALEDWAPPELRGSLDELLRLALHDRFGDADELAKSLEPPWDGRMRALIRGRPDELVKRSALAHIERNEAALRAASPAGKLGDLDRPVFLLHGFDDPVIPATESAHLAAELGPRATLLVSRALRHAESAADAPLDEKLALLRFLTRSLGEL